MAATIHEAVEDGDPQAVTDLLSHNPSLVHARTDSSDQPLHLAAWQDQYAVAVLLIENGSDINSRGDQGRTPLHYTAIHSSPRVCDLLLTRGANPNIVDEYGRTPLYWGALKKTTEGSQVFGMLLQNGASLDLHTAVLLGMGTVVRGLLLDNPQLLKNDRDADSLLLDAVQGQHTQIVDSLLRQGADPNSSKRTGAVESPLFVAVSSSGGDPEIVRLLIAYGADASTRHPQTGETPIERARAVGFTPAIQYLLNAKTQS